MKKIWVIAGLSLLLVTGCSLTPTSPVELSRDGPTVHEILSSHQNKQVSHAKPEIGFRSLAGDMNYNQIHEYANRRVPNPELQMLVYPRRDPQSGVIIPAQTIRFPMYNRIHYSLQREVGRGIE